MTVPVKPRRRYHSPQRQQQADATRRQIVDAAARLFTRDGYFGTTIEAIARQAGVADPTVYAAFGSKRAILSALIDLAIFGTDPPRTPVVQRSWYAEIVGISDARRLLQRWAEILCQVNARVAPVQRVVESASGSDRHIAELWQRLKDQRLLGQSAIAHLLTERQALRDGISEKQATDVLFVLSEAHLFEAYVVDRGWSSMQVADWLGQTLCAALLP
jgi:TetR/AcrR family transcriptional regulator, regulator of autoinduction and epiphytic fitness